MSGAEGAGVPTAPLPESPLTAIDMAQVRSIVRAMLRMRMRVGGGPRLSGGKPRGLIIVLVFDVIFGLIMGGMAFLHVDVFTYGVVLFAATLLMASAMVITESSQVLFDVHEADILGHRPIAPRTLLLAKSIILVVLSTLVTLAFNLFPVFEGLRIEGSPWFFPLVHLLCTILAALFCSGAVVFLYALLTRLVGRKRFDGFISWLQVGISVAFVVGYQVVPRLMERVGQFHIDPSIPWLLFLPPAWFGALESLLTGQFASVRVILMAVASVLASLALLGAAIDRLAGDYATRLATLGETRARQRAPESRRSSAEPRALPRLLQFWLRDPVERGAFRLAMSYLWRSRDVRMRLYPSIAVVLVFAFLPILRRGTGADISASLSLVMLATLVPSAMATLRMSPEYQAAEVFHYAPLPDTASLFHGVRKAVLLGIVFPTAILVLSILLFTVREHRVVFPILLLVLVAAPTLSLFYGLFGAYLPLSFSPATGQQGAIQIGSFAGSMIFSVVAAVLGIVATRAGWFWQLLAGEILVLAALHALMLRGIRAQQLIPRAE